MSIYRVVASLICVSHLTTLTSAEMIFESGTLGPIGVTKADLLSQTVPGTNVESVVFVGARFHIELPANVSRIGGHFVGGYGFDSFFGAIVRLSDSADFPNAGDLSTSDVLTHTRLTFPHPSDQVFGDVSIRLEPDWYALVFGSGLFGADGIGGAVRNGSDKGPQSYFGWQLGDSWMDLNSFFNNHRFVVEGTFVPEPSSVAMLVFIGGVLLSGLTRRRMSQSPKPARICQNNSPPPRGALLQTIA